MKIYFASGTTKLFPLVTGMRTEPMDVGGLKLIIDYVKVENGKVVRDCENKPIHESIGFLSHTIIAIDMKAKRNEKNIPIVERILKMGTKEDL